MNPQPRGPVMSRVTEQYERACGYLAGGVSASTRLNRAVGHAMLFDRAEGCRAWDLDGRAYPGRPKVLKLEGNFHGYHDQVMYAIGTPADRLGPESAPAAWPGSAGMPPGLAENLVLVPYNRPDLLAEALDRHAHELACVICEPVYYNAGCVLPTPEFRDALRRLTRDHGVLLIFDEVLSAFRMAAGGAQEYLKVTPDLCTLGKAVGGGFPLSVFGGRRDLMERLMPTGDCQHSGTYNGHPVAVVAGLAAVTAYREPGFYPHLRAVADRLYGGLNALFAEHGI